MLFGQLSLVYRFEHTQHLAADSATLIDFFSDVRNLDPNTPSYFRLHLRQGEVGLPLHVGQTFHYTFRLFGIPFPWTTEITAVQPDHFIDVQRRGPYRSFEHLHHFFPTAGGTMMVDRILYTLPFGPLNPLANALVVRPLLEGIFAFRRQAARVRFGELGRG